MKNFYNPVYRTGRKYERLSAYIDNELSDEELKKLEEELKFSKDLQDKLEELKRIKALTVSSVKSIEENPFFETRLAASLKIKTPWYRKIKKYSPVIGIVAASVLLMIVLKYNPRIIDRVVDQQKSNIAAFYKENLKPLLFTANLSNEDIFNFAFYHQLPLDEQKKQCLQLGSDKSGKQFFEIKSGSLTQEGNNLAKFEKELNLNDNQKKQVDSILSSYKKDLASQVLVNDKNTVAINPNIWNYNKALTADLISFAAKVNGKRMEHVLPPGFNRVYNEKDVSRIVKAVKAANSNKYIFLTPDSIFSDHYSFNEEEFNKEMNRWSKEMKSNMEKFGRQFRNYNVHFWHNFAKLRRDSSWEKNFDVYLDSNMCRVHIPKIAVPHINLPDMDAFAGNIDSLTNHLRDFYFNFPERPKGKNYSYKYFYHDSSKGYNFNFRAFGFDSSFSSKRGKLDSLLQKRFGNYRYGFNPDSMASIFKYFMQDSTDGYRQNDLREQLREFKKQMQQFEKEMEQMQKELHRSVPQPQPKKPFEI